MVSKDEKEETEEEKRAKVIAWLRGQKLVKDSFSREAYIKAKEQRGREEQEERALEAEEEAEETN